MFSLYIFFGLSLYISSFIVVGMVVDNLEDLVLVGSDCLSVDDIKNGVNRLIRNYHPDRVVVDAYVSEGNRWMYDSDFYIDVFSFERIRREKK